MFVFNVNTVRTSLVTVSWITRRRSAHTDRYLARIDFPTFHRLNMLKRLAFTNHVHLREWWRWFKQLLIAWTWSPQQRRCHAMVRNRFEERFSIPIVQKWRPISTNFNGFYSCWTRSENDSEYSRTAWLLCFALSKKGESCAEARDDICENNFGKIWAIVPFHHNDSTSYFCHRRFFIIFYIAEIPRRALNFSLTSD